LTVSFARFLAIKCTETSVPIINFFISNERHCSTDISATNLLEFLFKERGENSILVKKREEVLMPTCSQEGFITKLTYQMDV
jgi:hypothetical protein